MNLLLWSVLHGQAVHKSELQRGVETPFYLGHAACATKMLSLASTSRIMGAASRRKTGIISLTSFVVYISS